MLRVSVANLSGGEMQRDMTRIIVWTIVGILVVLGIIFLVWSRRQAAQMRATYPVSDKAYENFRLMSEKRVEQLKARAERAKAKISAPGPEIQAIVNELDAKLTEFETAVSELKGVTGQKEREEAVKNVQQLSREVRKLIRDIGGSATTPSGGE